MVVQTRLFSCRFSISHAKQRPATSPQRAARVRGDRRQWGTGSSNPLSLWRRGIPPGLAGDDQARKRIIRADFEVECCRRHGRHQARIRERRQLDRPDAMIVGRNRVIVAGRRKERSIRGEFFWMGRMGGRHRRPMRACPFHAS